MGEKISINGIAIVEGVSRNGIMYNSTELQKFAPTLKGRPILKDHVNETDNAIGLVTESSYIIEEGKTKVLYKGWIKEDGTGIMDKIKDGRIKEVSIGAVAGKIVKEKEDSEYAVAKNLTALELSTTPCPGVVGTSLGVKNTVNKEVTEEFKCKDCDKAFKTKDMLTKHYDEMHAEEKTTVKAEGAKTVESQISHSNLVETNNQKEVKMESEVKENNVVDNSAVVAQENAMLKKQIAEMNEKIRQEAIASYNKIVESKGLKAVDVVNATMETIKALTEMVESFEVKKTETQVTETKKVETKTNVVKESNVEEQFKDFLIEQSSNGFAFCKYY